MKRFLGILITAQFITTFGWAMEEGVKEKQEAVFSAIITRVTEENPALASTTINTLSWNTETKDNDRGKLIVNLNPSGSVELNLPKLGSPIGFRIGLWSVVWDVAASAINWAATNQIVISAPSASAAPSGAAAAAAPAPAESPADAARATREALKGKVPGDVAHAAGEVARIGQQLKNRLRF